MPTKAGEVGAVVLRAGSRYLTLGSVPEAGSLEVLRIEKVPAEWLAGELETGDTLAFPLTQEMEPLMLEEATLPESAREVWASYQVDGRNTYQSLRKVCSEHDLPISAQPSTEEMLDALMAAQVAPPAPSAKNNVQEHIPLSHSYEQVTYTPLELAEGIEEAAGPAAEEALGLLDGQVERYRKKAAVVEDYLAIKDSESPFESVEDVAQEHEVHWRTVHRYVADLLDEQERLQTAQA